MLLVIIRKAAQRGLLILLTCHRITPDAWPGNGLWYNDEIQEDQVLLNWDLMAQHFCGEWNVFAVDIQNEPHKSSWGRGTRFDWNQAAARIGNRVLSKCPRWLIFVEGVSAQPGAIGDKGIPGGYWWGGNLVGVHHAPIRLNQPKRLVYSPHTYGPGTFYQTYYQCCGFPSNMPAIWDEHWGFVRSSTGVPIVVGEWGGKNSGTDHTWHVAMVNFLKERMIGSFYYCLNPNSEDTNGILLDDWKTIDRSKLELLQQLQATEVLPLLPGGRPILVKQPPPPRPPPPPPPSPSPPPPPPFPHPPPPPTSSHLSTHSPSDASKPPAKASPPPPFLLVMLKESPPPPPPPTWPVIQLSSSRWASGAHLSPASLSTAFIGTLLGAGIVIQMVRWLLSKIRAQGRSRVATNSRAANVLPRKKSACRERGAQAEELEHVLSDKAGGSVIDEGSALVLCSKAREVNKKAKGVEQKVSKSKSGSPGFAKRLESAKGTEGSALKVSAKSAKDRSSNDSLKRQCKART